ncbi:MAG: hypothetical protein QOK39_491 [Acidimicrobiaceae bacterium]|jgi:hypothetical protein|nr:hypothetical protein [Acidimicrobiaceae bacterium]
MLNQQMARARMSDRRDRSGRVTRNRQLLASRQPDKQPRTNSWRDRTNRAANTRRNPAQA